MMNNPAQAADILRVVRGNRDAETWERDFHAVMDRINDQKSYIGGQNHAETI